MVLVGQHFFVSDIFASFSDFFSLIENETLLKTIFALIGISNNNHNKSY